MIDIHSHVLPSIDDGSSSAEESLNMIQEAYENGFTDIITTSHYIYNGNYNVNYLQRKEIIKAMQRLMNVKHIEVNLYNGAEAYITPELSLLFEKKVISTLANSRYVLFELPLNSKVIYVEKVITDLVNMGFIPIIAHPERYEIVQNKIDTALEWIRLGAYLQCNYASINGQYGAKAKKTLIKLLKEDAVTFLGTDCHSEQSIYCDMDIYLELLKKEIGITKLNELTTINPKKIINDELI